MQEKIFEPMHMNDTFFYVPMEKRDRCVPAYGFDDNGNLIQLGQVPGSMALKERPAGMEFESGGQGLWSTASDYLKFAKLFIDGGKILNADSLQLICSNQLNPLRRFPGHGRLAGCLWRMVAGK
jgi:CubicO group peptidase (beta-lactamase class C family)